MQWCSDPQVHTILHQRIRLFSAFLLILPPLPSPGPSLSFKPSPFSRALPPLSASPPSPRSLLPLPGVSPLSWDVRPFLGPLRPLAARPPPPRPGRAGAALGAQRGRAGAAGAVSAPPRGGAATPPRQRPRAGGAAPAAPGLCLARGCGMWELVGARSGQ